jgi:hypothetical protein
MMPPVRIAGAGALLGVLAFAGCYASTEPATDIQQDSARLNARGTANNGPAVSHFEYSPTNGTGFTRSTDPRTWPAGASGAFSETVTGLLPATPYQFRLCGQDSSAASAVCAQKRTFTTAKPPGDGVEAIFWASPPPPRVAQVTVSARSGPAGQQPSGTIRTPEFVGFVTCLRVVGSRAAVVSVGQDSTQNDPGPEYLWYTFAGPAEGLLNGMRGDGTGPSCSSLSLAGDPRFPTPGLYEIAIWDSP